MATAFHLLRSNSTTQPYYFTVISPGNGKTLAVSETYTSKDAAINGMKAIYEAMQGGDVQYDDKT
ncbi:DUF1508 domain-containing protein [Microbacterium sp. Leaf179]|uniref:DUF1508 domain-containing protein n=1 Tax=Microbacterium sp. Leaf179 TaxID=1736288 RepID=UPI0006FBF0D1|nr:DUF1508 domain-containing protein [Microbacterium sp. Leaf179]KQR88751.1 hypothetical protein ASF96_02990 [Microbacterium sp. Leaf179]